MSTVQSSEAAPAGARSASAFHPHPPETLDEAGISEALLETLVFKMLLAKGSETGRGLNKVLGAPAKPMLDLLTHIKQQQLVFYKDSAAMGDFRYALTEAGRERAVRYMNECSYVGPCPVGLPAYIEAVKKQTIKTETPDKQRLIAAFSDLLINDEMLARLGPAINSARGLFLYGAPGNGKSSISQRITGCFGSAIWIPHAIVVDGEIIKFFDPENHQMVEQPSQLLKDDRYDTRWIKIKRPTLIVGGELTMEALELRHNPITKITEPSVQMKSNGGTLVIEDFGRQRMAHDELLNRWIVPLEMRCDFLELANGKKIKVPFDQLIIFSTNLEPKDLVDEAFLRRIPYKIDVCDPTEEEYRSLFKMMADRLKVEWNQQALDHLIDRHYKAVDRPFRCCQPRDLLYQIMDKANYLGEKPVMTSENFDEAAATYFAVF